MTCGMAESAFWNATFAEIDRYCIAYRRQQKEVAYQNYKLASLITSGVSSVLGSKKPFPDFIEAYGELYTQKEKDEYEQAKAKAKEELEVARIRQFSEQFNKIFKQKEV